MAEGASAWVPGTAPPLGKLFPALQGRQQCSGTVWVRKPPAQHQTTQGVCGLLSQSYMEDAVPLSKTLLCLIKHGWTVLACKAGHTRWGMVPRIWQRFMSEGISGSFQPNSACLAGLTTMLGQVAQALIQLSAQYLQWQEIPPPLWCLSQGCIAFTGKSSLLTSNPSCSLCPGAFCPVTGHS